MSSHVCWKCKNKTKNTSVWWKWDTLKATGSRRSVRLLPMKWIGQFFLVDGLFAVCVSGNLLNQLWDGQHRSGNVQLSSAAAQGTTSYEPLCWRNSADRSFKLNWCYSEDTVVQDNIPAWKHWISQVVAPTTQKVFSVTVTLQQTYEGESRSSLSFFTAPRPADSTLVWG